MIAEPTHRHSARHGAATLRLRSRRLLAAAIGALLGAAACSPPQPEAGAADEPAQAAAPAPTPTAVPAPSGATPSIADQTWPLPQWPNGQALRHSQIHAWTHTRNSLRLLAIRQGRSNDLAVFWELSGTGAAVAHEMPIHHVGHLAQKPIAQVDSSGGLHLVSLLMPEDPASEASVLIQSWAADDPELSALKSGTLGGRPVTDAPLTGAALGDTLMLCWRDANAQQTICSRGSLDEPVVRFERAVSADDLYSPMLVVEDNAQTDTPHLGLFGWSRSDEGWRYELALIERDSGGFSLGPRMDIGGQPWPQSDEPPTTQGAPAAALLQDRAVVVLPTTPDRAAVAVQQPLASSIPASRMQAPPWAPPMESPAMLHDGQLATFLLDSFSPDGIRSVMLFPADPSERPELINGTVGGGGPATSRVASQNRGYVLSVKPAAEGEPRLHIDPIASWMPEMMPSDEEGEP